MNYLLQSGKSGGTFLSSAKMTLKPSAINPPISFPATTMTLSASVTSGARRTPRQYVSESGLTSLRPCLLPLPP